MSGDGRAMSRRARVHMPFLQLVSWTVKKLSEESQDNSGQPAAVDLVDQEKAYLLAAVSLLP